MSVLIQELSKGATKTGFCFNQTLIVVWIRVDEFLIARLRARD